MFKFKTKDSIDILEIREDLIKLVQICREEGRWSLYNLLKMVIDKERPESVISVLHRLNREYKLGKKVFLCIPRHKVTVKQIRLPSVINSEIENMVNLQAAKQLPFTPDKIISSYRILSKEKEGYSDVMMVLIHRDIVDNLLSICKKANLEIERLALSSEGLYLWYVNSKYFNKDSCPVCLVDIARNTLEVLIIDKEGKLDFSRSVDFMSTEDLTDRMEDEIKKTIFTYKKTESKKDIEKLILIGKRSVVNKEAPLLKKGLGLPTVYVDIVKQLPLSKDAVIPNKDDLLNDSFSSVLTLGFYNDSLETNLIPLEIRSKRIFRIIRESLIISVILFLCVIVGIGGIILKRYIDKTHYLNSIDKYIEKAAPEVKRLTRLKEITFVIKKQLKMEGSSIDIIRELYSKIPQDISLTILDYEDRESLLLRGVSRKLSDVFKFISILEESVYFENVKVRYATKRQIGEEEFTDFEIICQLTKEIM